MKKLLIAAGIAAATMASFNASAVTYDTNNVSHASVNSQVTGKSAVTVTGNNGGSFDTDAIKVSGNDLGSFGIQLPASAAGFGISGIHSHGFPDGFQVKFNDCKVGVENGTGGKMTLVGAQQPVLSGENAGKECVFTSSVTKVAVTTEANNVTVEPGTKTITADFTAYTN
ncbi:hypothetical protein KCG26_003465 [Salmonella enterica subsp. enterica serovar Oslo]|nr:hypothetical protein [Salmonella enterica subsp. enterica]EHK8846517.1 hypothetical protein [Salmonella enterica subsp. enterica serovar Oslo]